MNVIKKLKEPINSDWWKTNYDDEVFLLIDSASALNEAVTKAEVDTVLSVLNPLQPTARILDVCCGQGRHSTELARRGFSQIISYDYSHFLLGRAKEIAHREHLQEAVTFVQGNASNLPFANGSFDLVINMGNSFGIFEDIAEDLRALQEIKRVLKPNGLLWLDITDGDYQKANLEARVWKWLDLPFKLGSSRESDSAKNSNRYIVSYEREIIADKLRFDESPDYRFVSKKFLIDFEKGMIGQSLAVIRLYNPQSIGHLLLKAGFGEQKFWGILKSSALTPSTAGMMAQRIEIIAKNTNS